MGRLRHILIIDDSRSSLALLASVVSEVAGAAIDTCLSPLDALERTAAEQYDLVDNIMPELDGVEVTRRLRARDSSDR